MNLGTPDAVAGLLLEAVGLKDVARAGWGQRGVQGAEDVAAHSWGVAWLVLWTLPPHLDQSRALTYAVLHDLAEVRVGDLTPADGVDPREKHAREEAAMRDLLHDRPDLLAAWEAAEALSDEEARWVKQLDRLDMAVQAVAYASRGAASPATMRPFLDSAAARISAPPLRALLDALRARLDALGSGGG